MFIGLPLPHRIRNKMLILDIVGQDGHQIELRFLHIFVNLNKSFHDFSGLLAHGLKYYTFCPTRMTRKISLSSYP